MPDTAAKPIRTHQERQLFSIDPRQERYPMHNRPAGWYALLRSSELRKGAVLPLHRFGQELVVFRGEDGRARVFDPYCPHLGAHMGRGGCVKKNTLVCPYHKWEFGEGGRCVSTGRGNRVPKAGVRAWTVHEVNGIVFVYYDEHKNDPSYTIPELAEWDSSEWVKYDEIVLETTGHVLELQENLLDEAHFVSIHRRHEPLKWAFEGRGPTALAVARMPAGLRTKPLYFDVVASFYGPAFTVLRTRGIVDNTVLSMATPIDENRSTYRILFMTKKPKIGGALLARPMNRLLQMYAKRDLLKEASIWEQRIYPRKPVFSETDRSIPKYRKWYEQFHQAPLGAETSSAAAR